jgi:hypothetical protein
VPEENPLIHEDQQVWRMVTLASAADIGYRR